MNEAEWLNCCDSILMLEHLEGKREFRKRRLFACACCRRISHLFADTRCPSSLDVTERYADDEATLDQLREAGETAETVGFEYGDLAAVVDPDDINFDDALNAAHCDAANAAGLAACTHEATAATLLGTAAELSIRASAAERAWGKDGDIYYKFPFRKPVASLDNESLKIIGAEREWQSRLLRDVFGNPFRRIAFDPSIHAAKVVTMARTIYEDRSFKRMPKLADALKAAGCKNADILNHCRGPGPHVRGCWVVDMVLGKK